MFYLHLFLGDLTQLETSITFTIELLDINDHAPELVSDKDISIYENTTKVGKIKLYILTAIY